MYTLSKIGSQFGEKIRHPFVARVFSSASFYGGWTALVVYAASGHPKRGLAILFPLIAIHFLLSTQRKKDLIFLSTVTLAGCAIDLLLINAGVVSYSSPNQLASWAPPLWMAGVYLLFAAAIDYSLVWMRSYLVVAAILGAMGAVMSYSAGVRLGAAHYLLSDVESLSYIALIWFFFTPAVCLYSSWLDRVLSRSR